MEPHDSATIQSPQLTRPDAGETSVSPQPDVATTQTSGHGDNDPTMNPPPPHFFHQQMLCSTSRRDPSFDAYLSLGDGQRNDVAGETGGSTGDCRRAGHGEKNDTLQGTCRRVVEERKGRGGENFLALASLDQFLTTREQTQVTKVSAATGVRGVQLVQG